MKGCWTDFATACLKEVHVYYRRKASEKVANRIKNEILEKAKLLKRSPIVGQLEPNLEETGLDYRYVLSGNFKLIYLFQANHIFITDLFDIRRDPIRWETLRDYFWN